MQIWILSYSIGCFLATHFCFVSLHHFFTGFMTSGPSRELFDMWCSDQRNGVIIAGYSVEGTLAHVQKQRCSPPPPYSLSPFCSTIHISISKSEVSLKKSPLFWAKKFQCEWVSLMSHFQLTLIARYSHQDKRRLLNSPSDSLALFFIAVCLLLFSKQVILLKHSNPHTSFSYTAKRTKWYRKTSKYNQV